MGVTGEQTVPQPKDKGVNGKDKALPLGFSKEQVDKLKTCEIDELLGRLGTIKESGIEMDEEIEWLEGLKGDKRNGNGNGNGK